MTAPLLQASCLAMSLLAASASLVAAAGDQVRLDGAARDGGDPDAGGDAGTHLQVESRIRDVLNHPAFNGFARLLLPWDNRSYDENLPMSRIGSLLPYHSEIRPDVVVSAINHMIDEVGRGRRIFYDIYTAEQKAADPSKADTGLFLFRGRPGAPFAIIAPGGGFSYVGSLHEGFPYAVEISKRGYNAFVLKYRAGQGGAVATQDLAAALSFIFRNAEALGVGVEHYSLWGSSAGARMAAAIGSQGAAAFGGGNVPKPSAVVMAYTAYSAAAPQEPSTFVVVGENDGIAPPAVMERRVATLRRTGTTVAYRKYPRLGHGFGLGTGTSAEGWVNDAISFWDAAR